LFTAILVASALQPKSSRTDGEGDGAWLDEKTCSHRGLRRGGNLAKEDRGFASMDRTKQRDIASKGGKAAHQKGTAHEWTSEEAREAGRKGGMASHRRRQQQGDDASRGMASGMASSSENDQIIGGDRGMSGDQGSSESRSETRDSNGEYEAPNPNDRNEYH
jgi:general stress protein YciG